MFLLGEEIGGESRVVRGNSVTFQATEREIEGGIEFADSESR